LYTGREAFFPFDYNSNYSLYPFPKGKVLNFYQSKVRCHTSDVFVLAALPGIIMRTFQAKMKKLQLLLDNVVSTLIARSRTRRERGCTRGGLPDKVIRSYIDESVAE
jgi:hypothetical protein